MTRSRNCIEQRCSELAPQTRTSSRRKTSVVWKAALGNELHLFLTALDGRIAATGLFTEHRGIVQAHLVGTDDDFREWSPLKLLLDDVRRWASERGNDVLHLGGGVGGRDDSLLAFKRRFSPQSHRFSVGRWVLDPAAYADLAESWRKRLTEAGGIDEDPSYFPLYRSPRHGAGVEFRVVSSHDQESLAEVFVIDDAFFRPHPFTLEEAQRLASYSGRDVYALLADSRGPSHTACCEGWGRGLRDALTWDRGSKNGARKGIRAPMMNHLHAEARPRGADRVRLRVHPDNVAARRLYESLGYENDTGEDRGELVMVVDLDSLFTGSKPGRAR